MSSTIPIQNLYYLLSYSWNRLAEAEVVDVDGIDSTELVDLFSTVLLKGTQHLLRRGIERGYELHSDVIPGVRGRIDIASTAQRLLAPQGLVHCEFDELTNNTLANQIIKSTIFYLIKVPSLNADLRKQLQGLIRELNGIDVQPLRKQLFRKVQLHANARYYKFLLSICELVSDSLLVEQGTGNYKFRDFTRDEVKMRRVFEEFLINFYKFERNDLSIKKEKISWVASSERPDNMAYLPTMETDISIRSNSRTLIIDAKYYKETLVKYYDRERIHSTNLYQLFAYLKNIEFTEPQGTLIEGMLLYPVVNKEVRLEYEIHGHNVRICTVNLASRWSDIKVELLELINNNG